jgi:hypothetical protein
MNRIASCLLSGGMLLCVGLGLAVAQEASEQTTPPPKVLAVFREFLKPGKAGSPHEKTESAFVQAAERAKWPEHYLAVNSITGKQRALFFYGYDSFEAWEKDNAATEKNAALSAALDRASIADGELLSELDSSMLVYDEGESLRAAVDIAHMRYMEISVYRLHPGHRADWEELVKLVQSGYDKIPEAHWAMYEAAFGQEGTEFVVIIPRKSASEIDQTFQTDKQFSQALGEDGMKRLRDLEAAAIEFSQSNLFQFSPKMSYPPDDWVKADPDFWKPKPAAMPKKTEEKPAAKQ